MSWNIVISSDECDEHPGWIYNWKDACQITEDGKCNYKNCPRKYMTRDD